MFIATNALFLAVLPCSRWTTQVLWMVGRIKRTPRRSWSICYAAMAYNNCCLAMALALWSARGDEADGQVGTGPVVAAVWRRRWRCVVCWESRLAAWERRF